MGCRTLCGYYITVDRLTATVDTSPVSNVIYRYIPYISLAISLFNCIIHNIALVAVCLALLLLRFCCCYRNTYARLPSSVHTRACVCMCIYMVCVLYILYMSCGNVIDLKLKCNQSLAMNDNFPVVSSPEKSCEVSRAHTIELLDNFVVKRSRVPL